MGFLTAFKLARLGKVVHGVWTNNEVGRKLFPRWFEKRDAKREAARREAEAAGGEFLLDETEDFSMGNYNKLWAVLVGGALTLLSRWFPVLEGADAQAVVEAVMLLLTALGVWAVPNKPAA